ncbi:hypothetical protein ACIOD2_49515 [Amycolatopsis sp. NPDC088138]|uniref:ATP dependent DNA ligase n=1 Tax=Amycolatopsis sp. NPDC088138 TaxID=3363938 RepID=UPI00381CCE15
MLGGLLLGAHDPESGELIYIGAVGTGFSQAARADLLAQLEPHERRTHPFVVAPPREDVRGAHWVEPELVGEIVFLLELGEVEQHPFWRVGAGTNYVQPRASRRGGAVPEDPDPVLTPG